jgi:Uma2 family endonuclease
MMEGGATPLRSRRWTRVEYGRLIDCGILREDDPVELVEGHLVVREPQRTPHAVATQLAAEALRRVFGSGWTVRVQLPLALGRASEPEPDVAVVRGAPRDFLDDHPSRPALVVEVAGESLRLDRTMKAQLYARHRVGDYWIVNLRAGALEVRRRPFRRPDPPSRWGYRDVAVFRPGDLVRPLAAPRARVPVADLIP